MFSSIVINIVAIMMLARQRIQVTFHMLMTLLAVWDLSYLIISIGEHSVHEKCSDKYSAHPSYPYTF